MSFPQSLWKTPSGPPSRRTVDAPWLGPSSRFASPRWPARYSSIAALRGAGRDGPNDTLRTSCSPDRPELRGREVQRAHASESLNEYRRISMTRTK